MVDERVEVLAERLDVIVGDALNSAHLLVGPPGPEAHASVVEDDHRRRPGHGRQEHVLVDHHPVVPVLGLERPVEGRRDAPVHGGVAWDAPRAVRSRQRFGVFDARLHVEIELARVHRHQKDLHVRPLFIGADERHEERRRCASLQTWHFAQPRDVRWRPRSLAWLGRLPDARDGGRRPVCLLDRRLRGVEGRGRPLRRRGQASLVAGRTERQPVVRVSRRERLIFHPRDGGGADPRHRAQRVDHPVREALRKVHRRARVHPRARRGREVASLEVEPRGADLHPRLATIPFVERDRQPGFVEREADGGGR